MFDLGFSEIILIAVVAILVLGPSEIPKVMYNIGRVVRRLQYVRYAFSHQFEEFLKEHDLHDMRGQVNFEAGRLSSATRIKDADFDETESDDEEHAQELTPEIAAPEKDKAHE